MLKLTVAQRSFHPLKAGRRRGRVGCVLSSFAVSIPSRRVGDLENLDMPDPMAVRFHPLKAGRRRVSGRIYAQ